MSDIANVVINDGQAIPVAHTFYPTKSSPTNEWREDLVSLPVIGQGTITVAIAKNKGLYRVRQITELPALEEATGANAEGFTAAPKVAHVLRADTTYFAHVRSTKDQRNDLIELHMNAMANAQIRAAVTALILAY